MREAVICEPLRTPVGRFGAVLRDVPAASLAATVIRGLLERTGLQAIADAAMRVQTGICDVVIAGGAESMSQVEFYTDRIRWDVEGGGLELSDRLARARVTAGGEHHLPATAKVLERAGIGLDDLDLIELNEAFAAQVLAVTDTWGLDPIGDDRFDPNGSGISLGHPVGATGARILATMLRELDRRGGRYALETMCIGGGQGMAALFERAG